MPKRPGDAFGGTSRLRGRVAVAALAGQVALHCLTGAAVPAPPGHPPSPAAGTGTAGGEHACPFPAEQFAGTPWQLQGVLLDELWQHTRGRGVRVAVIDTGVDDSNPQLTSAVDTAAGRDLLTGHGDGTNDETGHGTQVAGIIAARPRAGTGFVGLAPEATVIPIRQNDARHSGRDTTMAVAIDHAISTGADIINISQDTARPVTPHSVLGRAVRRAVDRDVVVVAAAGNHGNDGIPRNTYPAAFDGVLAVGSSDRGNRRAVFSQPGEFVDVAAPGVDIVSTVPGHGHCAADGTSFSAPYAAGVAALLRAVHPAWTARQVVSRIEQTAERGNPGHDPFLGWGVVDPVRALETGAGAGSSGPAPEVGPPLPQPARREGAEAPRERTERLALRTVGLAVVLVALVTGTGAVVRDSRQTAGDVK